MRVSVVVPTLNPGKLWEPFSAALLANLRDLEMEPGQVLILDSASTDGTPAKARKLKFRVLPVLREYFDHGGTRQLGVAQESASDVLVYLTQDAILADSRAIRTLLEAFADPTICAAYGRQLPRPEAGSIEVHARLFNYPPQSRVRCMEDRRTLGFKSIFSSNSFCAFRREALLEVGGFPERAICSEETIAIGRMHQKGWRSAYVAEAQVYHSHPFTVAEELKRYFDVGVTHAREPFLVQTFGTATGEGRRFVLSELRYLLQHEPTQIATAAIRTLTKMAGYRLGRREGRLSLSLRKRLSMNPSFWLAEQRLQTPPASLLGAGGNGRLHAVAHSIPKAGPQKLHPKPDLRRAAELATEVARVTPIQQQRYR